MLYPPIPSASGQLAYLTDIKRWEQSLCQMQLRKRRGTNNPVNPVIKPIYAIDMYKLAEVVKPYSNVNLWNKLWPSSFDDDSGSGIFTSLETIFPVNIYNQPLATEYKYKADIVTSPIIPELFVDEQSDDWEGNDLPYSSISPIWKAEKAIWKAAVFPLYPLLVTSSVPEHEHYGPVFASNISFKSSGASKLGNVEVSVKLEGGRGFQCPIIPVSDNLSNVDYVRGYREAVLSDCLVTSELAEDIKALYDQALYLYDPYTTRMVEISLDIEQKFDYVFTCHKGNIDSKNGDSKGAKYISLEKRTVKGKLVFYSTEYQINLDLNPALTMYFGGPYLFSMQNVQWQKPTMAIKVGEGYLHTFEFIARASDDASADGFMSESKEHPISEFYVMLGDQ